MASFAPVRVNLSSQTALRAVPVRPFSHLANALPRPRLRAPSSAPALITPDTSTTSSRHVHTTPPAPRRKPFAHNHEPVPDQPPPTDFGQMDVLGSTPVPATAVQVCHEDGFSLNSGVRIAGGEGALLVGGEAFVWRPWSGSSGGSGSDKKPRGTRLVNERGQWEVGEEGFAILGMLWPRPDLLILGLGPEIRPLSPATRRAISDLGMRVEVLDTRNAASQYNMLATERGVDDVAAALIPIGWKEGAE